MNKQYSFFHRESGVFSARKFSAPNANHLPANTPAEHLAIEGNFDTDSQRVDMERCNAAIAEARTAHEARVDEMRRTHYAEMNINPSKSPLFVSPPFVEHEALKGIAHKFVVDYQPPQPSDKHEWNATSKRWQLTKEAQDRIYRDRSARIEIAKLEQQQQRYVGDAAAGLIDDEGRRRLVAIRERVGELRVNLLQTPN